MNDVDLSNHQKLNPKVIIVFCIKNFLNLIYIVPIWWIAVSIFEQIGNKYFIYLPQEQTILILNGAGIIYVIILALYSYYWALLSYSHFSYALEGDGLHIYRGVFLKKTVVIPYNYIQDIQVYIKPFVARLLGIYNLHIKIRTIENTAGILHRGKEEQLEGLTPDVLNNLKNQLIATSHVLPTKPKAYFNPAMG